MTTARYPLPTYCDAELYDDNDPERATATQWTAQDYTLCHALDLEDNHAVDDLVSAALEAPGAPEGLAAKVTLDSEAGCFFAHTDTEDDMAALADLVADLVAAGPYPAAIPGDIMASPAFINTATLYPPT